jgi:predicted CopG family antitoxin
MLLSSGKLVKNPQLVMKYLEELKKRGIEIATVIPGREELEIVEKAVKEKMNMLRVVEELIRHFKSKIDAQLAKITVKEVLREEVDEDTASYLIAKELSAWVLEIAETLNIIKISRFL